MPQNLIYEINSNHLKNIDILNQIYENKEDNYYVSLDFSKEFYILQARAGFISTSIKLNNIFYLLCEIQFEYAILDFKNLHISKKVKSLIKKDDFIFRVNHNIELFFKQLNLYHKDNWLIDKYEKLIKDIFYNYKSDDFKILTFEVYDKNDNLISAEIGYKIEKIYTSLSGFCSKDKKYNNYGKLQLTLTANYLQNNKFLFWNLGHPYMNYKFDLGATLLTRKEFLKRWLSSLNVNYSP
ncbi:hypothetical protein [Aliarcobacter skirrowii]|uniref:Uncharacterized protein n=1 Tax=Aliarcobacter skirrowii TaxID=28200 RepID=A0A2U2C358_9BACT|nr:hypothetical protein [Aliarcobacter skirrowii]PWE22657.1 hypothetical protein DGF29_01030 [Aliarcobacter skirrowii]PWE23467.1 hypothetical protein DF188_01940 [Aliarcobacter skirrowii]PWE25656.1 hypothetical protein DGE88_04545 [Aliarcobacter skirrowii]RJO56694.1 hypothetical protein DIR39_01980 [Aliarcobacter skirrowii]RJO58648.1 hypothetical protein DIR38_01980 [Aliarcobacter skirrowii]